MQRYILALSSFAAAVLTWTLSPDAPTFVPASTQVVIPHVAPLIAVKPIASTQPYIAPLRVPGPLYLGYAMDGSYMLQGGAPEPYRAKQSFINAAAPLGAYGFKALTCVTYEGCYRDAATIASYFGPIKAACDRAGLQLIPGMYLQHVFGSVFGPSTVPSEHQLIPIGFADARVYADYLACVQRARETLAIRAWYIDLEWTYWQYESDSFYKSDRNVNQVACYIADLIADIEAMGVTVIVNAIAENPSHPEYNRISGALRRTLERRGCRPIVLLYQVAGTSPYATLTQPMGDRAFAMASSVTNTPYQSYTPDEWNAMIRAVSPEALARQAFFGELISFPWEAPSPYSSNVAAFARLTRMIAVPK